LEFAPVKHRKLAANANTFHALATASRHLPASQNQTYAFLPNEKIWPRRMYAIAFDLDTEMVERTYGKPSWRNAYEDIRRVLALHYFDRQQGSVYFGDAEKVDPVRCVLAVQDLTRQFAWFAGSVSDVRMLRIEENNDLRPAIDDLTAAIASVPPRPESR
jgi:virulence-associated protein VapD